MLSVNSKKKDIFKIGIISGKGGVGKTTISGSLSVIFNEKENDIIAADCDVDAPNLALLFEKDSEIAEFKIKTTEKAFLSEEKCIRCGTCVSEDFCEFHALNWDSEKSLPVVDPIACEGCGACAELCSEYAYEIKSVDSGIISHIVTKYGFPLVWGETVLGASTSGKLVTEIKTYIDKICKNNDAKVLILDGPPGIGCPVVASVTDLNYVMVIIEPTSTALHDAKRAIGVLEQLDIRHGIVINKFDAWEEGYLQVKNYAKSENIPIIGLIPVDNAIPESIVKGKPVVSYMPDSPAAIALKKIYLFLKNHVLKLEQEQMV